MVKKQIYECGTSRDEGVQDEEIKHGEGLKERQMEAVGTLMFMVSSSN